MAKRPTIGANPLDAVIPAAAATVEAPVEKSVPQTITHSSKKERVTFHLPQDLIDRARNAVYWTPGLTLAGLAEDSIREALDRLEKERGEQFPERREELRSGRPVK